MTSCVCLPLFGIGVFVPPLIRWSEPCGFVTVVSWPAGCPPRFAATLAQTCDGVLYSREQTWTAENYL